MLGKTPEIDEIKNVEKCVVQREGKLIETGDRYSHVMAVTLDDRSAYTKELVRCITSRSGDVAVSGYVDTSELHSINGDTETGYLIGDRIQIHDEEVIINKLQEKGLRFLGLEDPDIYFEDETGKYHLFFTMPYITTTNDFEHNIEWIDEHASPGPFYPRIFVDLGEGKLLGFINGREANRTEERKTVYGTFSVGLYIYDYERGLIEWVSSEPCIRDSEAKTITFASQFVPINDNEGIIMDHVDDSFVRSHNVTSESIKELLIKYGRL